MRRAVACVAFLPALIGWLLFAPAFRLANLLYPSGEYGLWNWCGISALKTSHLAEILDVMREAAITVRDSVELVEDPDEDDVDGCLTIVRHASLLLKEDLGLDEARP